MYLYTLLNALSILIQVVVALILKKKKYYIIAYLINLIYIFLKKYKIFIYILSRKYH